MRRGPRQHATRRTLATLGIFVWQNYAQRSLTVSALTVRVAVVSVGKRSFERVLALRGCQMQGRLGLGHCIHLSVHGSTMPLSSRLIDERDATPPARNGTDDIVRVRSNTITHARRCPSIHLRSRTARGLIRFEAAPEDWGAATGSATPSSSVNAAVARSSSSGGVHLYGAPWTVDGERALQKSA